MSDGWLSTAKYERTPLVGCTGPGTMVEGTAWKFVCHSTESPPGSIDGVTSLFRARPCSAPHLCIDPAGTQRRAQYIPWIWSACALRGGRSGWQTNRARAVQMEICGYAEHSPGWSDKVLWQIADVIADVILDGCPIDPHQVNDTTQMTGVLATENSRYRMAPATWHAFAGITWHVEVPFNDHWDCGRLRSKDVSQFVLEILSGRGMVIGPTPTPPLPPAPVAPDDGYLRAGMTGGIVRLLQQALMGLGYSCGVAGDDGVFGPATDDAVRRFQADEGIAVDGIAGPVTCQRLQARYGALTPAPTPPAPPAPDAGVPPWGGRYLVLCDPLIAGNDVRTWQQQMANRGWRLAVDGWYGPQSYGTAKTFQAEKGLVVDGVVGRQTWDAAWTAPVT